MALKAVLFDMDGVIVDTEPLHKKAYFLMFDKVGITVSNDLYESYTGQSTLEICKDLVSRFKLVLRAEELVAYKRAFFKDIFFNDNDLQLMDGVLALIKDYHRNHVTLILASSASMFTINSVFDRFNLGPYFKGKLSGADLKASKPHPEIFVNAAKASGFNKDECIVIEDSTNGIKASYDAGIYCVAFKSENSKNQDYTLANKVITSYKELAYNKIKDIV
ncbi:phosphatase/phosphohexomutase family protein [Tenacibaculum maritimum]|uniref:HAD family hydrolase n=1 Tax=Tenacibaculum maritimum TaxID=107401 RepID=UPI0012E65965|nr:HAD-IA family hydrolase [Tenacibaculum maritimum]CAA0256918.1 phosphatase/phosphohexomutase family protein [Tenacibaculum maritimum]